MNKKFHLISFSDTIAQLLGPENKLELGDKASSISSETVESILGTKSVETSAAFPLLQANVTTSWNPTGNVRIYSPSPHQYGFKSQNIT